MSRATLALRLCVAISGVLVPLVGGSFVTAADPERTGYPNSMASTGDSITRANNICPTFFADCPEKSWSTGSSAEVASHYHRILAEHPPIGGQNHNDAVSGARITHLQSQLSNVNTRNVEYVTILMGANDVCTTSEATMTPVATFRTQFEAAMETLTQGSPDAAIFVSSIPDIYILWEILKDDSEARAAWSTYNICQSLLANPLSNDPADVERRQRVRERNIEFNVQLEEVCAEYIHCRWDDGAVFGAEYAPVHLSREITSTRQRLVRSSCPLGRGTRRSTSPTMRRRSQPPRSTTSPAELRSPSRLRMTWAWPASSTKSTEVRTSDTTTRSS
jgi:hypothetical protein